MKRRFKKFLFIFVLIFVSITNVYATDLTEAKDVTVINHINNENKTISIKFKEEIPYVKLTELYKLISDYDITINNLEEENYEITINNGEKIAKATINTKDDTLYSNDYGLFTEIPDEEDSTIMLKNYTSNLIGTPKDTSINFTKYKIDLYGDEDNIWIPVTTAFDMFNRQGYYDGENINILDYYSVIDSLETDEYNEAIARHLNDTRNTNLIEYNYNELCFILDYYYGYPTQSILSDDIKEHGLDYTLENYNKETKEIKEKLLSSDIKDYYLALAGLSSYLFDNGHTNLEVSITTFMFKKYKFDFFDIYSETESFERYNETSKLETAKTDIENNISNARENILDDSNYIEKGDTALFAFDEFKIEDKEWIEYYENGGEYPNDTVGNLLKALDKAKENPEIKNFIIDISKNGGGLGITAPIIMDFLGYETNLQFKNMGSSKSTGE